MGIGVGAFVMKTLVGTIILLGWFSAATASAAKVDLAPKFLADAENHYISRSVTNHEVRVDAGGVAETVVVRSEAAMTLTVTSVDATGSADLVWRLRYLALSTDGAMPGIGQMLDYDSRDATKAGSPLAPLFSRLIEKPVTVRVDAAGRVLDFKGVDTLGLPGPLGGLAQGFFSRQAFEQLPLFVTSGAPSPARVRAKWSKTTTVEMPLGVGSLSMEQKFVLKRISARHKTAVIEMKGLITKGTTAGSGAGGVVPSSPGQPLVVNDGTVKGEYVWDSGTGRFESAESQLHLETTLDTPLGRMDLKQDMTSSVTRTSLKDMRLPDDARDRRKKRREGDQPGG